MTLIGGNNESHRSVGKRLHGRTDGDDSGILGSTHDFPRRRRNHAGNRDFGPLQDALTRARRTEPAHAYLDILRSWTGTIDLWQLYISDRDGRIHCADCHAVIDDVMFPDTYVTLLGINTGLSFHWLTQHSPQEER
jgi:hypothetical protein